MSQARDGIIGIPQTHIRSGAFVFTLLAVSGASEEPDEVKSETAWDRFEPSFRNLDHHEACFACLPRSRKRSFRRLVAKLRFARY